MIFKKKKNLLNRIFINKISLMIIGFIVLILISIPLARSMSKRYRANDEINDLQKEIAELEGKNTELKDLIQYLNSDSFVEEQARLKLNYKKKDEEVFVIKNKEEGLQEELASKSDLLYFSDLKKDKYLKETNLIKWRRYFFGI